MSLNPDPNPAPDPSIDLAAETLLSRIIRVVDTPDGVRLASEASAAARPATEGEILALLQNGTLNLDVKIDLEK